MKIKKTLIFIAWMILLFSLLSCKASYHYKQILKKDPAFFAVDTTTVRTSIPIAPVTTSIDCESLTTEPIVIRLPANVNQRKDSVSITLSKEPNGNISATVDCPDSEVITKMVPAPYPVYVKPSLKEKLRLSAVIFICILIPFLIIMMVSKKIILVDKKNKIH
jgi:hypothetical protein